MTAFTLDTSGAVRLRHGHYALTGWGDLAPFEQGYVEAMFASQHPPGTFEAGPFLSRHEQRERGFSDLAPETLAAIRKDCADYQRVHADLLATGKHPDALRPGRLFWIARQQGACAAFPPLTVSLGDDGKVYARAAA